jgi:hypothetical protein
MRRFIPFALVGVLALVTIGAALIGRGETPAGGPGTGGNAVAQSALSKAVRKTLAAESLTMSLGRGFTVVYEAPDLTDSTMPFQNVIQVGSRTLTKASGQWLEGQSVGNLLGPTAYFSSPSQRLRRLLHLPDLEFKGAQTFVSKRVLAPTRQIHSTVTVIETVHTADGFVVSDRTTYRGLPSIVGLTCGNCQRRASATSAASSSAVTFSDFNSSHVSIPASNEIVTRTTVATRKIGHDDHLAVYEWASGGSSGVTTGFSLTNGSGTQIDGGSGGPTGTPISGPDGLFPEGGGSSGPGSWSDVTVSVSGKDISEVRLVVNGETADAMVPAKLVLGRFVVLLARVPKGGRASIQGLNASGHVVTSTPYSW